MAPFEAARVRPSPRRTLPPSRALLAVGLLASYAAMWVVMKGAERMLWWKSGRGPEGQYDETRWPDELARRAMRNQEAARKKLTLSREEWDRIQALEPHAPGAAYRRPSGPILDPRPPGGDSARS